MSIFIINVIQVILYFFSLFFIINLVKTRVYIYLILNFFCYIIYISFIFYYLRFEIIAFLLLLVYAGAVVILFTFVVMLYENHKLLFIGSSYSMMFFLFIFTSIYFFFFFNSKNQLFFLDQTGNNNKLKGPNIYSKSSSCEDIVLKKKVIIDLDYDDHFYCDFLPNGNKQCGLPGRVANEVYIHDVNFFDDAHPQYLMSKNLYYDRGIFNNDGLSLKKLSSTNPYNLSIIDNYDLGKSLIYFNLIDSTLLEEVRIPYVVTQDGWFSNITLNNNISKYDLTLIDYIFFFNRPVKFNDIVTNNKFIIDKNFFDLMDLYSTTYMPLYSKVDQFWSKPLKEEYEEFNFDFWFCHLHDLLAYTMHNIRGKETDISYSAIAVNRSAERVYMEFWSDDMDFASFMDYYGYEVENECADFYGLSIERYNKSNNESLEGIFRVFHEIGLVHTNETVLNSFVYFYTRNESLFNIIGIYLYNNCIFEFMVLGMMLFICLICIMRLLKLY